MNRRQFASAAGLGIAAATAQAGTADSDPILPGIWRVSLGNPEPLTPVQTRRYQPALTSLAALPHVASPRIPLAQIVGRPSKRGYEVSIPLEPGEMIYGLGLMFQSFLQRGLKKKLRVNADPVADTGDSHAPVPFYVSTRGYGIFVDTARYANIYCGNTVRKNRLHPPSGLNAQIAKAPAQLSGLSERLHLNEASQVLMEVPAVQGVDIYLFAGPTMRAAIQRYNLFAGGGALPPRWGLGFWYRCYEYFNQSDVLAIAEELRRAGIPCDVLGLEPGWQTHAYSCTFVWSDKFPDANGMIQRLRSSHYRLNLWEHAFTNPASPIYQPLLPYSGDYEVWGGIVPDFASENARAIFGDYHDREFIANGVSGFKLDECDNSDYTGNWSFPELSRFPSGVDGEQMHCFFGLRYQDAVQRKFESRGIRTLGLVRSSHALAAPYPYVLYSDLYDHKQFIRAIANAGFTGLLWCPEVRDAKTSEDLIRRLQTVIFSPVAMVNAWYIKNPPWKQVDREANNAGRFSEEWQKTEALCRKLIEIRMQLVPYLYSAFVRYRLEGLSPFRALVVDYPEDPQTWMVDLQYLCGDSLLVAPVVAGEYQREIYLPRGDWFDFWSGKKFEGNQKLNLAVPLEHIPVFVKSGTLLPIAQSTLNTDDPASFHLTVRAYGEAHEQYILYEDDGSPHPVFTRVALRWKAGDGKGTLERPQAVSELSYVVEKWERIAG